MQGEFNFIIQENYGYEFFSFIGIGKHVHNFGRPNFEGL